jgi:hypothetical protein
MRQREGLDVGVVQDDANRPEAEQVNRPDESEEQLTFYTYW